jgi:UPF0755 protein
MEVIKFTEDTIPQRVSKRPLMLKILGAVALVIALVAVWYLQTLNSPYAKSEQKKALAIESGARARDVSKDLKDAGLIKSTFVFDSYAYASGLATQIKAGEYVLSTTMSPKDILNTIVGGGKQSQMVVRIQEGWTIDDIASYFDKEGIAAKNETLALFSAKAKTYTYLGGGTQTSLEGYLFPDTYFVKKEATADQIIDLLISNMEKRIDTQMRSDISAQGKSINEILIMASLVEKEVGRNLKVVTEEDRKLLEEERKMVAGVFYNRLAIDMALQSDATVTYLTKKKNPSASLEDIQIDSPYNTYKYPGLPPTPISNPSLSAIKAAIYPAKHDYYYFLSSPDGKAYFAKTFEEHQQNRVKYLK